MQLTVTIDDRELTVWPNGTRPRPLDEPTALYVDFEDIDAYHDELRRAVLAAEQDQKYRAELYDGGCGVKLQRPLDWGSAAIELVHRRALHLYRLLAGNDGVVDDFWGNIYRRNDHCLPHSHLRATAGVVYFVDVGEASEDNPASGLFYFADPRSKACCKLEAGRMTHLLTPVVKPGTMLIFPGMLVHGVTPYRGDHARITLSWNIGDVRLAGSAAQQWRQDEPSG